MISDHTINQQLLTFFSQYPTLIFNKKEHLLRPHQFLGCVFYLKSGYVRQYAFSKSGRELTLNIFKPGSILFFVHMFCNKNNQYYFQTLTKAEIYSSPFDDLNEFLEKKPQITLGILQRIGKGLGEFINLLESMVLCTSREKLATVLLILARKFGQKKGKEIIIRLPMSHYDLACLIGTARETVSIELKKMEKSGLIYRNKKLSIIRDIDGIKKMANTAS